MSPRAAAGAAALISSVLAAGCAGGGTESRFESYSGGSRKALKRVAVASFSGPQGVGGPAAARELVEALSGRFDAVSVSESDSVLAGGELDMSSAGNPGALAEIKRATGAEAVIFVLVASDGASLEVTALDAGSGEAVLRRKLKARGGAYASAREAARAAAAELAALGKSRRNRPSTAPIDDIPVP